MDKERYFGLDLLRIVLMFFIILGHLFAHTNIRVEVDVFSAKGLYIWLSQSLTVSAVNCFILITGFFMLEKNVSFSKMLKLWGKVLFYSISIYLIMLIVNRQFVLMDAIHSFFPVVSQQYWFFSNYLLLTLFIPFLNKMINNLSDKELKVLLGIIVFVFYCLPIGAFFFGQFDVSEGMGIIGFVTLYIIGAGIKRFNLQLSKAKCLIALAINCLIVFFSKLLFTVLVNRFNLSAGTALFYHYNTIFQLINAVLLFVLFKNLKINNSLGKIIVFLSPMVFSVYLIHEHPLIRKLLWQSDLLNYLINNSFLLFIINTLWITIALFIVCIIIEMIRLYFAKRIVNTKLGKKIKTKIYKLNESIQNFLEN
jgi:surface polysaccharide O-acyltransferase-like enzyme